MLPNAKKEVVFFGGRWWTVGEWGKRKAHEGYIINMFFQYHLLSSSFIRATETNYVTVNASHSPLSLIKSIFLFNLLSYSSISAPCPEKWKRTHQVCIFLWYDWDAIPSWRPPPLLPSKLIAFESSLLMMSVRDRGDGSGRRSEKGRKECMVDDATLISYHARIFFVSPF